MSSYDDYPPHQLVGTIDDDEKDIVPVYKNSCAASETSLELDYSDPPHPLSPTTALEASELTHRPGPTQYHECGTTNMSSSNRFQVFEYDIDEVYKDFEP